MMHYAGLYAELRVGLVRTELEIPATDSAFEVLRTEEHPIAQAGGQLEGASGLGRRLSLLVGSARDRLNMTQEVQISGHGVLVGHGPVARNEGHVVVTGQPS